VVPGHPDPLLRAVATVEDNYLKASSVCVDHDHGGQSTYLAKCGVELSAPAYYWPAGDFQANLLFRFRSRIGQSSSLIARRAALTRCSRAVFA